MLLFSLHAQTKLLKGLAFDLWLLLFAMLRVHEIEIAPALRLGWLQIAFRNRNLWTPRPPPIAGLEFLP
jgi:hypothetical protein